jgi:hypothetical protein
VFTEADVDKAKSASKAATKGPWVDWTDRMWEKTAGRRLFAKLPMADEPRVYQVVEADRRAPDEAIQALYGPRAAALTEAPPPHSSAADDDADQREAGVAAQGAEGTSHAGAATGEPPAPPPPDEDIDWPDPIGPDPAQVVADLAGEFVPPSGKYSEKGTASEKLGPLTIAAIYEIDPQYVAWAARKMKTPQSFVDAALAFTRFYMPAEYQAAMAERATS